MSAIAFVFLAYSAPLQARASYGGASAGACCVQQTGHPVPDSVMVRRVVEATFGAAERRDMAALDTLYAGDSLTVIEGAGINRGWSDYRDRHLGPELGEMQGLRYRPYDFEVHVNGDQAWTIFRYTLTAESQGRHADVVGRGTAILERTARGSGGRRWVVRHIHTSGRARRAGDPVSG